jgi:hypothetical protein
MTPPLVLLIIVSIVTVALGVSRFRRHRTLKQLEAELADLDPDGAQGGLRRLLPSRRPSASVVVGSVAAAGGAIALGALLYWHVLFGAPLGEPCSKASDCQSGRCLVSSSSTFLVQIGVCSRSCLAPADCPEGMACSTGACTPVGTAGFGERCLAAWDCKDSVCLAVPDPEGPSLVPAEGYCSRLCGALPCPGGSECLDVAEGSHCVPRRVLDEARARAADRLRESVLPAPGPLRRPR